MDPYYIFPPEIWEMIFNQLKNPQDKLVFIRVHSRFQQQFGEQEEELSLALVGLCETELEQHLEHNDKCVVWKEKLHSLQLLLEYSKKFQNVTLALSQWFKGACYADLGPFAFPELPYLQTLKLTWEQDLHFPIQSFDTISNYFPQLVQLEFEDFQAFPQDFLGNIELFPNLKSLKLSTKTTTIRSSQAEIELRRIFKKIAAVNLIEIEVAFHPFTPFYHYHFVFNHEHEKVKTILLFCLNKINKVYSHPNSDYEFRCSSLQEQVGLLKLTFSRTLPTNQETS